ncbi:MAG TPA: hypothetical protein PLC61_01805 [Chitinophagales bacterium]|nr:hypothetical protein [Chitinophagales bacterium]MCB9075115.1 hypothetical protein [Chitinophagales bacterium]HMU97940.1 hypothetical protein [Chitinophagales bacterium]HMV02941.1 hypothetical protein [Chitinophagales bacterium]HMW93537.1 hypothetical protein [Chitinophagales bacterium]
MNFSKLLILSLCFIVVACKNKPVSDNQNVLNGKYEIKKAIVETSITIPNFMEMNIHLMFDDYGKLHKQITKAKQIGEIGAPEIISYSLIQDDYIYNWDNTGKHGTRIHLSPDDEDVFKTGFNFKKVSADFKDKYQLKKIGSKTIKGKDASIYTLVINGNKLKYSIWKNIPLEFEAQLEDRKIQSKLISIDENPNFEQSTFEIPKNITFDDENQGIEGIMEH